MYFTLFPTSLGDCGVAWRDDCVIATSLPERTPDATATRLSKHAMATRQDPPNAIRHAIGLMTALLGGEAVDLLPIFCDFRDVDPFEARVYTATRAIPAGETSTYGAIAEQLGNKRLAQNVGRAMGRNPVPIIVPCHRVVGANDKLVGFSAFGGVETKRKMLLIERGGVGETGDLFGA